LKLSRIRIQLVLVLAASVASLFFGASFMMAQGDKRPNPSNTDIAAAELVSQQAAAIIHALMNEKPGGLHLRQAVLTLQTGTALEKGIEINLVIFTISNKKKIGLTDTTTLSFDDKQLQEFAADFVPPPSLDQQFKQQLDEAVTRPVFSTNFKQKKV
jgi:beta-lactam-binding protein with PASTA domain